MSKLKLSGGGVITMPAVQVSESLNKHRKADCGLSAENYSPDSVILDR
jgi:hypothetical protein